MAEWRKSERCLIRGGDSTQAACSSEGYRAPATETSGLITRKRAGKCGGKLEITTGKTPQTESKTLGAWMNHIKVTYVQDKISCIEAVSQDSTDEGGSFCLGHRLC